VVEADDKLGLSSPTITLRNASQLARYADLVPFGNFSQNFKFEFEPLVVPGVGPLRRGYFVIITPIFSFVWISPIVAKNESDE
jgi:hypothetical protein